MVAVSKLCCPICWELLDVLKGGSQDYSTRGHHYVMSPAGLPLWLPADVVQEMVVRFRRYLRKELIDIHGKKGRKRSDSQQTDASITSSEASRDLQDLDPMGIVGGIDYSEHE
jgi:hypothetical protein